MTYRLVALALTLASTLAGCSSGNQVIVATKPADLTPHLARALTIAKTACTTRGERFIEHDETVSNYILCVTYVTMNCRDTFANNMSPIIAAANKLEEACAVKRPPPYCSGGNETRYVIESHEGNEICIAIR